jgi:hypothetical protein
MNDEFGPTFEILYEYFLHGTMYTTENISRISRFPNLVSDPRHLLIRITNVGRYTMENVDIYNYSAILS